MRLALYLGPGVDDMPLSEYMQWQTFIAAEGGLPHEQTNELLAKLCALVANLLKRKGARAKRPEEFLPEKKDPRPLNDRMADAAAKWAAWADTKRKRS